MTSTCTYTGGYLLLAERKLSCLRESDGIRMIMIVAHNVVIFYDRNNKIYKTDFTSKTTKTYFTSMENYTKKNTNIYFLFFLIL